LYIIIIEGEKNQWTTEAVGCYPIPSLKTAGGKKNFQQNQEKLKKPIDKSRYIVYTYKYENVTCPSWGEQYQASHVPTGAKL